MYNLASDIGETKNVAKEHPEIVKRIAEIMQKEHTYSEEFSFSFEKVNATNN